MMRDIVRGIRDAVVLLAAIGVWILALLSVSLSHGCASDDPDPAPSVSSTFHDDDLVLEYLGRHPEAMTSTVAIDNAVDLIETREDIIYRILAVSSLPGANVDDVRGAIDEVLRRDFATWPLAPGARAGAGGILDSGGPNDTTSGDRR